MSMMQCLQTIIGQHLKEQDSKPYHCPVCGRFIPLKEIDLFGRISYVQPKCKCDVQREMAKLHLLRDQERKDRIEKYFRFSTLGERFDSYTFDRFIVRQGTEKAYEMALDFAERFDEQDCGLFIYGDPGNGKSHLAGAIAHYLRAKEYTVVFQSMPMLLQRIRATFGKNNQESEQEIMNILTTTKLLVIDDLGAEKVSEWVLDVLFRILDGRYQKALKTVITSNLKPTELKVHLVEDREDKHSIIKAERLIDRILETSNVIHNQAKSYRQQIALERAYANQPKQQ